MQIENWQILTELFPDYLLKLGVALVCGAILGFERERKEKPAGLRTIVLITVGSTLFMIVSELIPRVTMGPPGVTQADPARVAAQVVSGIGFLGAGTIIQARGSVHGLTTAAIIWVAAAIGLLIGIGFPLLAIGFTLVVLASLLLMGAVRSRINRVGKEIQLTLRLPNDALRVELVRSELEIAGAHIEDFDVRPISATEAELTTRYMISEAVAPGILVSLLRIEGVRGAPVGEEP